MPHQRGAFDAKRIEEHRDVRRESFHQVGPLRNARHSGAAQVETDNARGCGECIILRVPDRVRERKPMNEQNSARAFATIHACRDARAVVGQNLHKRS
jgi:hypothetical protein